MISESAAKPYRFISRDTLQAGLLFTALAIVFAYPLSLHPATLRFPTGPDGDLGWYILGWDAHAFLHKPWAIFDANIYYPLRRTLAYGENVIGIAFFAAPVIWMTHNLNLAANFVALLSTVLCGLGAYVLARRVGLGVSAALIAGIIWECAPPRFFRIGQMTLSSVEWIPFALASLHAYLDEGRPRDLRLAAGFTSLQVLSTGHGAVFVTISLLLLGAYRVLLGEPLRLMKRIRDLGVVGIALLLPAALAYLPYRAVQQEVGLRRGLGSWERNYDAFLASPSHLHQFVRPFLTRTDVNATANAYLFPGYAALALALVAVAWPLRGVIAAHRSDRSGFWTRSALGLELVEMVAAAAAGILTVATLVPIHAGTERLIEVRTAAVAWLVCACIALLRMAVTRRAAINAVRADRRRLAFLLAAALAWIGFVLLRSTLHAGDGLVAQYFSNSTWTGPPAAVVVDPQPSGDIMKERWDGPPPEQFSARWTGFLTIGSAGSYTFATSSDDGSQLIVDDHLVVDNRGRHGLVTQSGRIHLRRGSHRIELRYVQFGGNSALSWSWARNDGSPAAVPMWALSQHETDYPTVIGARVAAASVAILAVVVVFAAGWFVRAAFERRHRDVVRRWAEALRQNATAFYLALTILTAGFALGPPYGLWQYVYWLPGFTFIRAHSRFMIVALLGIALLAGIGFDRITSTWSSRRRAVFATIIGIFLIAEYAAMPMGVEQARIEIPAIDRWLDSRPKPFVIAEVPLRNFGNLPMFEAREVEYMIHSTAHWQKTVHGYSGWRAAFHWELFSELQNFPDDRSIASLSDLGVTYVVVHTDLYPTGLWPKVEERLEQFSARLHLEHVEGAGRVYTVLKPVDAAADGSERPQ